MNITTIKKVDLKKLMREKGIKSIYQLARMAQVDYSYLKKAHDGFLPMSEKTWEQVKKFL